MEVLENLRAYEDIIVIHTARPPEVTLRFPASSHDVHSTRAPVRIVWARVRSDAQKFESKANTLGSKCFL